MYLAVALSDADRSKQPAKRRLDGGHGSPGTTVVITEAYFNGEVVQQQHFLRPTTDELTKKYARIQAKRFKQEKVGGLRRKPKVEYVPQDARIGELYDEMSIEMTGFTRTGTFPDVPLRFKTFVIHHIFGETVAEKK
jgi:hypothetical protein